MEHLSNDQKDCPNQYKNNHKLCNEMGHQVLSLRESQWKQNNNVIKISQWREDFVEQILASEDRKKSKRVGL